MAISQLSILSMLRTKMQWHQERQRLLAENVANADTPNFRPRELNAPEFRSARCRRRSALQRTDCAHIAGLGSGDPRFGVERQAAMRRGPAETP